MSFRMYMAIWGIVLGGGAAIYLLSVFAPIVLGLLLFVAFAAWFMRQGA